MSMPVATQVVAAEDASVILDQGETCRIETVVAIDLHEQAGHNVETSFEHLLTLLHDFHAAQIGSFVNRLLQG